MNIGESVGTAVGQIAARKVRAFLTMLGVIIGVGSVVAMSGMAKGAADKVRRQVVDRRYADLTLYPVSHAWGMREGSTGFAENQITLRQMRALRRELRCARSIAPYAWQDVECRYRVEYHRLGIIPAWTDYFRMYRLEAAYGRVFTDAEAESDRPLIVLGAEAANGIGNPETIVGEVVYLNGRSFTVVGVLAHTDLRFMWKNPGTMGVVPFDVATSGLTTIRTFRFVRIDLRPGWTPQKGAEEVERLLRRERGLVPGQRNTFSIRNDAAMAVLEEEVVATFARMLLSIGGVSLVVGGFGIMSVMLVSVRERTPEIGVRRALGATRRAILLQFFIEALALALLGGMIGVGLGVGASAIAAHASEWSLVVSPGAVGIAVAASASVGLASGAWPAYRASRLDPVDALRYE